MCFTTNFSNKRGVTLDFLICRKNTSTVWCENVSSRGYGSVFVSALSGTSDWKERVREAMRGTLEDRILSKLLERSNLTKVQFETILLDQIGSDMADKTLTREEMTQLRRKGPKISRGAFNRTLGQARENVAESVHTVLLLGWSGLLESASLAPFVEASERLRIQTQAVKDAAASSGSEYASLVDTLLSDLEDAFDALRGKKRDA